MIFFDAGSRQLLDRLSRRCKGARLVAAVIATALGGCASFNGPYQSPSVNLPAEYRYAITGTAVASRDAWWKNFNDPKLNRLIESALVRNNNLAAATIRVRRAQLQAGLADNNLMPQFSGSANTGVSRRLESNATNTRTNSVSLGASYEFDLWNKLGSQRDVARWEALATEQDRASTALTLIGTTAQLYWQLGYLNERLASGAQSVLYAQKTYELVQAQYRAGAVSGLEVSEAQQSLASQQSSQSQLQQQVVEAQTALALLFDGPPGAVTANPQVLPEAVLPAIAPGLPADILGRRPDLQAAELRVRGSFTSIDATRASFYPSLSLTGSLGSASAVLMNVLENPVAALGLGVSLPFLNQTKMKLNIQVSEAQYEEAVVNFRQTLYTALGDVENALSARQQLMAQARLLNESLVAASNAERLYEIRYRAGAATLKSWLDAQERRRTAEIAAEANRLARLNNHVAIYKALGGDTAVAQQQ